MRATMEVGCDMQEILRDGMQDKNTSAGVGFAHFDRRDAGLIKQKTTRPLLLKSQCELCFYIVGAYTTSTGITQKARRGFLQTSLSVSSAHCERRSHSIGQITGHR